MGDEQPINVPEISNWKKNKITVSLGTLAAALVGLFLAHQFAGGHLLDALDNTFLSEVEASELTDQLAETTKAATEALNKANENSEVLVAYIRRQLISESRQELRSLESTLQETLLWESANGENEISRDRKNDLELDIEAQEARIECLMTAISEDDCD